MPGVFTSRGCAACRKQKKRCHAEGDVPPCQRCKRLDIDCIGLGQRRFKFQDESSKVISIHSAKHEKKDNASTGQDQPLTLRHPTSALSRLTAAYVQGIDPHEAIAIQLPWNFGPFVEDVPRYLGANESLDAAVDAVVAGYSCLRSRKRAAEDRYSLRKYSKALSALANALSKPETATASETLCATKMLMIFEVIAGIASSSQLSHAGGAARIFKARGFVKPKNVLEANLLGSLRGPVMIQSLFLTYSYFTDAEWAELTESGQGPESPEEQSFRCFAQHVRLFQRARQLLTRQNSSMPASENDFAQLEAETNSLRLKHASLLQALRERFWGLDGALQSGPEAVKASVADSRTKSPTVLNGITSYWTLTVIHAHIARSYGIGLACQTLLNALLLALRFQQSLAHRSILANEDEIRAQNRQLNKSLIIENALMSQESCQLAEAVSCHRPLGTIYMALVLRTAYIGAGDADFGGEFTYNGPMSSDNWSSSEINSQLRQDAAEGLSRLEPLAALPTVGSKVEVRVRQLLRFYLADFEVLAGESEAEADLRMDGELNWLKQLFTLTLKEPTYLEKQGG